MTFPRALLAVIAPNLMAAVATNRVRFGGRPYRCARDLPAAWISGSLPSRG